jgi:hypothetical protein
MIDRLLQAAGRLSSVVMDVVEAGRGAGGAGPHRGIDYGDGRARLVAPAA